MIGQVLQLATILGMLYVPRFTMFLTMSTVRQCRHVSSPRPPSSRLYLSYILPPFSSSSRANLIHPNLIKTTIDAFPRNSWSEHFASVVEKELTLKPWCHTSTFEVPNWAPGMPSQVAAHVRNNQVMQPYD